MSYSPVFTFKISLTQQREKTKNSSVAHFPTLLFIDSSVLDSVLHALVTAVGLPVAVLHLLSVKNKNKPQNVAYLMLHITATCGKKRF